LDASKLGLSNNVSLWIDGSTLITTSDIRRNAMKTYQFLDIYLQPKQKGTPIDNRIIDNRTGK
jgi:hypothetical protein